MGFANPVMAGKFLVRQVMQSVNFVTGVSGWAISRNGSAQFNNVTIRGGIVIGGTTLVYEGTPAAGNLIASIASAPGTDPMGNPYQEGFTSYLPGVGYVQMIDGQVNFFNTSGGVIMSLQQTDTGGLVITGGSGGYLAIPVPIADALTASEPGAASFGTAETWHTASLGSGWTGTAQYTARPDGTVALRTLGSLGAGTITSGTTLFTLPAAYEPAVAQVIPAIISAVGSGSAATGDSPYLQIGTNGAVDVFNISTQVATNIRFAGSYSLS